MVILIAKKCEEIYSPNLELVCDARKTTMIFKERNLMVLTEHAEISTDPYLWIFGDEKIINIGLPITRNNDIYHLKTFLDINTEQQIAIADIINEIRKFFCRLNGTTLQLQQNVIKGNINNTIAGNVNITAIDGTVTNEAERTIFIPEWVKLEKDNIEIAINIKNLKL